MTTQFYFDKEQYLAFNKKWREAAQSGILTAPHFMLYNLIRGKHPQHGFTPFKRPSKFYGMGTLNRGSYQAWQYLKTLQKGMRIWIDGAFDDSSFTLEQFLEPFGETFTVEDFHKLEIPKVESVWTVYGKGTTIAERIEKGEITVETCEELDHLFNTDVKVVNGIKVDAQEAA